MRYHIMAEDAKESVDLDCKNVVQACLESNTSYVIGLSHYINDTG